MQLADIFADGREYQSRLLLESKDDGYIRFNRPRSAQLIAQLTWEDPKLRLWGTVKSRKAGVSSHLQAFLQHKCHASPDPFRVLVGTNHTDTTREWERRADVFREGFPRQVLRAADFRVNHSQHFVAYERNRGEMDFVTAGGTGQGRGGTRQAFAADELQSWRHAEQVFAAMSASLSDEAATYAVGTPNGPGTFFYRKMSEIRDLARKGDPTTAFHFIPWFNDPDYVLDPVDGWEPTQAEADYAVAHGIDCDDRGQLVPVKDMRRLYWRHDRIWGARGIGESMFRREYPATFEEGFLEWKGGWFDTAHLNSLLAALGPQPHQPGELRMHQEPMPGEVYAGGLDPAWCTGGDDFAFQLLSSKGVQVATFHANTGGFRRACEVVARLARLYNDAEVLVEANTGGAGPEVIRLLEQAGVRLWGTYNRASRQREGWTTNKGNKEQAYSHARQMVNGDAIELNDAPTVEQLLHIREERGRIEGQDGSKDDLAMALVLAEWCRTTLPGGDTLKPRRHQRKAKRRLHSPETKIQKVIHGR